MNNDKSKPYWTVQTKNGGTLLHDINGVAEDEYMDHEYDDAIWAKNACDRRNLVNGQC